MYTSRALNKWTKQGVHTPLLNVQSPLSPEQARSPCFCCTDCWHLSLHGRKQLSLRASCFEGSASIKLSSLFPVCKHHDNHLRFNTCLWCSSVMLISLSLLPLQPPPTLPCLFLSVCLSLCVWLSVFQQKQKTDLKRYHPLASFQRYWRRVPLMFGKWKCFFNFMKYQADKADHP